MIKIPFLITGLLIFASCSRSQDKEASYRLIGSCEGCDAVFEYGNKPLSSVDTLPDFSDKGPGLKISGTIYKKDGKSPAENVILYVYHTDQNGIYATKNDAKGWAVRHGYIRGWIKTGSDGRYTFYTLRPGVYPSRSQPAHIHPVILEPDGKYYWLGSYFFADDTLLTKKEIAPKNPRADSPGVIKLHRQGKLWIGHRDFILGRNIPGYNQP
jgi:protocatechuate 3,4-dioxygenase beta subunit